MVADDTPAGPPPGKTVYRATVVAKDGGQDIFTVLAKNPDEAVGLVIDRVGHGLLEGESFWDEYRIKHLIPECVGTEASES